jgi:hypothetical protein
MQAHALLVLHDAHGDLEQLDDHGAGLGVGQFGLGEEVAAQGLVQDVGGAAGEEEAPLIGEEVRRRSDRLL